MRPPEAATDDRGGGALLVQVLGHVRAVRGGVEVELGPPKHRAVLAALAMAGGRPVDVEQLAGLVWPEEQVPARPASGLHVYVSGLRRVLEPPREPGFRHQVLTTGHGGYALDLEHVRIDAVEVCAVEERAARTLGDPGGVVPVTRAAPAALEAVVADADAALARCSGVPYGDLVETVDVLAARARLLRVRTSLVEHRAVAQLCLGRHGEVVTQLGGVVPQHPLDERLWTLYALALARSDRQADALEALRTVRHQLVEELGVDPGPTVRELEGMLLRQDEALRAPLVPVLPPAASGRPDEAAGPAPAAPSPDAGPEHPEHRDGLVGRAEEWRLLQAQRRLPGTRLVQLVGESGIGKSAVVEELVSAAGADGDLVVLAHASEDEGAPPLWPWAQVVQGLVSTGAVSASELDAQLGELLAGGAPRPPDPSSDPEMARFRLYEAVTTTVRLAGGRQPLVLVLEDLHWADASSLRLLAHLVGSFRAAGSRPDVLLVVTRRPVAVTASPALRTATDALARSGAVRIELGGLAPRAIVELARRRVSWSVDEQVAEVLHERTGGNPFLVLELVSLGRRAVLGTEVPAGVTDVVGRRLASLPDRTRTVIETAAVLGHEFDVGVLAATRADEVPADAGPVDPFDAVLDDLDPAVASGQLVDLGGDRMAFAHALTRDAVYAAVSPARRARLHARVAAALDRSGARPDGRVGEQARHWLAAGPRYAGRAWRSAREAAVEAEGRLAADEAADLYEAALTALALDPAPDAQTRSTVARSACAALLRAGRWGPFLQRVEEAARAAEAAGDVEALAHLALMPAEAGPWTPRAYGAQDDAAIRRLRRVLDLLPSADDELRCRLMLALGSELYYVPHSSGERQALVEEGLAMARRLGDQRLAGQICQRAALVLWHSGNAETRLALADEAVAASDDGQRLDEIDTLLTSLALRMSAALEVGSIDQMLADVARFESLLERRPSVYQTVVLACLYVPWLAAQDRLVEARSLLARASRVGDESALPWSALALGSARVGLAAWSPAPGTDAETDPAGGTDVIASALPVVRLLLALRAHDVAEVDALLDSVDLTTVPDDFTTVFHHAVHAEAAYVTGRPALAARAYTALAGEAGHVASAGTGLVLGPVDAFLALAAATAGDLASAAAHAEKASALVRDWGLSACDRWLTTLRAGAW